MTHGDGGTHACCNARLKEEGGKARCCTCVPHDGCEMSHPDSSREYDDPTPPAGDWEKEFDRVFPNHEEWEPDEGGGHPVGTSFDKEVQPHDIKSFISTQIEKAKQDTLKEVGEMVEGLRKHHTGDLEEQIHKELEVENTEDWNAALTPPSLN